MKSFLGRLGAIAFIATALFAGGPARGADVLGYSVLKGHFLLQTGPGTPVTDPDYAYSVIAAVDLTDFDLVTNATVRTPAGVLQAMDNLADAWVFFDTRNTLASLNSAYGWGNYTVSFKAIHDGAYACVLSLPNTALPPAPHLTNFAALQAVNPAVPLTLHWDFPSAPQSNDFVQAYITDGHDVVFSTPELGEPGALDGTSRSAVIPAGTLDPGVLLSLNLEITRLVSTNTTSYPLADGITATFSSTAIDLTTIIPPRLRILPATNGILVIEVRGEADRTNVLQASDNLGSWQNLATNVAPVGKSVFNIPTSPRSSRMFRAWRFP